MLTSTTDLRASRRLCQHAGLRDYIGLDGKKMRRRAVRMVASAHLVRP
jgi:hypothetical protein